jgi:hypothetical protein
MRRRFGAVVALAALVACGPSFSMTPEQIEKDIVNKATAVDGRGQWGFGADEPRKIKVIETKQDGKEATVVIEIVTESKPALFSPASKMGGRLRLHYEWIADQWNLVRVENLTFKPM